MCVGISSCLSSFKSPPPLQVTTGESETITAGAILQREKSQFLLKERKIL